MTRTGTIKLIYKEGAVNHAKYNGPQSRREIIEVWRSLYGEKFYKCFIQIRPDITNNHKYDTSKSITGLKRFHPGCPDAGWQMKGLGK